MLKGKMLEQTPSKYEKMTDQIFKTSMADMTRFVNIFSYKQNFKKL